MIKLARYAIVNWLMMAKIVVNLSVSVRITAKFDAHGQYKSTNTKNESALALLKKIKLELAPKLAISEVVVVALFRIDMVERISSFAIIPTNSAHRMPALFSPIGASVNDNAFAILYNMLSLMFWQKVRLKRV